LPWSGLLRVKVRTSGVRWISIRGGGLDMAGDYTGNLAVRCVA
jgi:hypothetical protein